MNRRLLLIPTKSSYLVWKCGKLGSFRFKFSIESPRQTDRQTRSIQQNTRGAKGGYKVSILAERGGKVTVNIIIDILLSEFSHLNLDEAEMKETFHLPLPLSPSATHIVHHVSIHPFCVALYGWGTSYILSLSIWDFHRKLLHIFCCCFLIFCCCFCSFRDQSLFLHTLITIALICFLIMKSWQWMMRHVPKKERSRCRWAEGAEEASIFEMKSLPNFPPSFPSVITSPHKNGIEHCCTSITRSHLFGSFTREWI